MALNDITKIMDGISVYLETPSISVDLEGREHMRSLPRLNLLKDTLKRARKTIKDDKKVNDSKYSKIKDREIDYLKKIHESEGLLSYVKSTLKKRDNG